MQILQAQIVILLVTNILDWEHLRTCESSSLGHRNHCSVYVHKELEDTTRTSSY